MKILLTRHGQTDWNILGKIQGITDIELNETGIKQAEIAREKLLKFDIDVIISSPLKRARKTAEIIGKGRNIPIIIDEGITERSWGKYEGYTTKDMNFEPFVNIKQNKKVDGIESIGELFNRVNTFLGKLKDKYYDKTVLLVTHNGTAGPIRVYFEGIPDGTEVLRGLGIENCEVLEYEV